MCIVGRALPPVRWKLCLTVPCQEGSAVGGNQPNCRRRFQLRLLAHLLSRQFREANRLRTVVACGQGLPDLWNAHRALPHASQSIFVPSHQGGCIDHFSNHARACSGFHYSKHALACSGFHIVHFVRGEVPVPVPTHLHAVPAGLAAAGPVHQKPTSGLKKAHWC